VSASLSLGHLLGLTGVVAFGAVIPIVPTGAAVSLAAAVGERDNVLLLLLVVAFGAVGAYTGDIVTYAALRFAGAPMAKRVGWLKEGTPAEAIDKLTEQVREHELRVLLLSRLVPGGRVPVLLAAALGGYSWRRFAIADIGAATLWSAVYAAIGVAGRAVFPKPWQGAVAAICLVLLVSLGGTLWRRAHPHAHALAAETPDSVTEGGR
jgi:membrane protein DedA with SNARE-associated domain